MGEDTLAELMRNVVWVSFILMLPPLGVALILGLGIGLLQAITSVQEQTLSFVPKMVAVGLVYIVLGDWMLRLLIGYSADLLARLPEFGAL